MENDFCKFKGWKKRNFAIAKLARLNEIISGQEHELKKIKSVINNFKLPLYQQLENAVLQKKIQVAINTFPSFTSNLREAAEFVSEFACDSDDDLLGDDEDMTNKNARESAEFFSELACDSDDDLLDDNRDMTNKASTVKERVVKRSISINNSYNLVDAVKKKCIQLVETQRNLLDGLSQPVVLLRPLNIPDLTRNTSLKLNNLSDIMDRFESQSVKNQSQSSVITNVNQSLQTVLRQNLNTPEVPPNKVKSLLIPVDKSTVLISETRKNVSFDQLDCVQDQISLVSEYQENDNNANEECVEGGKNETIQSLSVDYNLEGEVPKHVLNIHGQNCLGHEHEGNSEESDSISRDTSLQTELAVGKVSKIIQFTKKEILNPNTDFVENKQDDIIDTFLNAVRKTADDSKIVSVLNRNYICNYCDSAFLEKSTLRKHILICSMRDDGFRYIKSPKQRVSRKTYDCKLCQKTYISKTTFTKHNENKHHLTRPYKCLVCRWAFYNEKGLQHHCRTRHGLSEFEPFKCPFCRAAFSRRSDINYHCRKYHSSRKWFACSECYKSFKSESALHRHEGNHGYRCDVCSFNTRTENEMQAHRLTHLQIITYRCEICSRIFDKKGLFTKHIHRHLKEKNK